MRKRLLIACALLLLGLPVAGVLWLIYTEAGLQRVAVELEKFEHFGLKFDGLSGTIAGPLRIERFELDHPRVHLVLHDVNADFRLSGLWLLKAKARSLTARDVSVQMRRVPDTPEPDKPLRFLPRFLNIDASAIEFTRVRYVNFNGFTIDADRLSAQRARMSLSLLRIEGLDVRTPLFTARGSYQMVAQRPLRLALDVTGTLKAPHGNPLQLQAQLTGTIDELLMAAQTREPYIASVHATLTRPNDSWRVQGRIVSPSLGLENVMAKPPLRFEDVALKFDAGPENVRASGELTIPGLGPLLADATGQFAAKRLTIDNAELRTKTGRAQLAASGWLRFGGDSPQLEATATWANLQWPLQGKATVRSTEGRLRIGGSMPYAFDVAGSLGGENVPAAQLHADGELSKDAMRLASYEVRTLDGALAGAAQLDFAKPQSWSLTAQARNLDPAPLHAELPGRVSFIAQAHGTGFDRTLRFDANIEDLRGELRGERIVAHGRVERSHAGWHLHEVDARWGGAHAAVSGLVGERVDVQWSVQARSLQKFWPSLSGELESTGSARGKLKMPHVIARLSATKLQYLDWRTQSLRIDADVDAGSDRPSRLELTAEGLGRDEPWFERIHLRGSGVRAAHELALELTGVAANGAAAPYGRVGLAGRYEKERWEAELRNALATDGRRELKLREPTHALIARNQVSLEPICFVISTGQVCGHGQWQRDQSWSAEVELTNLPLATLLATSENEQRLSGTVSGHARGGGSQGQRWLGEADLHVDDATLQYRLADGSTERVQLGSGALAAAAGVNEIAFNVDLRALENTFMRGAVQLTRTEVAFMRMPLQGQIRARTADANLLPLLLPEIDRAAGVLEADIALGGMLAAPKFNGRVSLAKGELDSYRVNLALRELQAVAELRDTGLQFDASARAGDGRLKTNGRFTWDAGRLLGSLSLTGSDLLVSDLSEYRLVASPDLTFKFEGNRTTVAGNVVIPSARIQPADLSGAVRVSEDAHLVGEHAAERQGRLTVSSEVRIVIGDDVLLDTFGLQGKLQGDVVTLVRTGEPPIGRGELSVKEGRYEAYGQNLEITRGRLLFDSSPLDDPALDIQAERKLEEIKVGLNVRGTLRAPRLSFFSEPSMPQTQIVEYLLVGKPLDQYQNRDAQASGSARDALALQGGGLIASRFGRRLGLEEVGVESDGENGAALVLGKFLSPRVFVSYGISLAESINTLKLRYTISDHWMLRTESGEDHAADLEFTIER